jgi:aspartate/methionine/tyrosine aminotransferase
MTKTAARLSHFPNSAISEMMKLAHQCGAISLVQGSPDFDPPVELIQAAERALRAGYNQYSLGHGSPGFREALSIKQERFMGIKIDPEQHITVTCGGTEAMLAVILSLCNPGDKVIVFSPYYESYGSGSLLAGAEVIYVPLYPPDFRFDTDELHRAFQLGVKALILCNPSNPCGKVFNREELETIARLAQEYDAVVITDEVYEHIVYAPMRHIYIASLPGMFERTISCSSLSKTYAVTGWRLGYTIAPPDLTEGIRKLHDFLTISAPAPLQEAAIAGLELPESYYQQMLDEYSRLKDVFLGFLDQAGLKYIEPQGAYYVLIDISPFGFSSDYEFCDWMAREVGVAGVPGSYFFHEPVNHLVRLNFAKRETTLKEAGERLMRLREKT